MIDIKQDLENINETITFHQLLLCLDHNDNAEIWSYRKWGELCDWENAQEKGFLHRSRPEPFMKPTQIAVLYNQIALYDKKVHSIHIIGRLKKRLAIVLYDIADIAVFFPEDLLKNRIKTWSKGNLAHATIFGQKETLFQIIEEDIKVVRRMRNSRICVITDFDFSDGNIYTATNSHRYRELQLIQERHEVYNFSILNDKAFMEQLFVHREDESVWLYIMSSNDDNVYDNPIWHKLEKLMVVGRQYNIIVTFASSNMSLRNDNFRGIICNTEYLIFTPSKNIELNDVKRIVDTSDISFLEYKEEYDDINEVPILIIYTNCTKVGFLQMQRR